MSVVYVCVCIQEIIHGTLHTKERRRRRRRPREEGRAMENGVYPVVRPRANL